MKTIIYVDGYNLYYGCLKHTNHKWLDIHKLFSEHILRIQNPQFKVIKIKYFTADIKTNFSPRGPEAGITQNSYNRALTTLHPNLIEIIKGFYSPKFAKLPKYQKPPNKSDSVEVWRLEEKQTDVNIALHMYRDVMDKHCEQIVLVSNDSDLTPALKMIREKRGDSISIGVIMPIAKTTAGKKCPANAQLIKYADWSRSHILDNELEQSQLPDLIPTKKKPIRKPDYW